MTHGFEVRRRGRARAGVALRALLRLPRAYPRFAHRFFRPSLPFLIPHFSVLIFLAVLPASAALRIDFSGNEAYGNAVLRNLTPEEPERLREDDVFDWAADAEWLVERHYRERGYLDARVAATVTAGEEERDWTVTIVVEEGRRYRYDAVRVIVDGDSAAAVPGDFSPRLRAGRPYAEAEVIREGREIRRAFGNAGFVRADVRQHILLRDSAATASVTYTVDRGAAVVFDTLIVRTRRSSGPSTPVDSMAGLTRESLLRSFLDYRRGDTLRIDLNDAVIEKLLSTGQFNSVRLEDELLEDGSGRSRLILDTEEKVPGRVGGSIYYETQYGFGVSAQAAHSNLAGTLQEGRLGAGLAQRRQTANIGYGSPLLFGTLLRFDNDLRVEWYQDLLPDAAPFQGDFRAANFASLSRAFGPSVRWVGGAELEYKSRVVADSAGLLSRENAGLLTFMNTGFLTMLDNPFNPARGARLALTLGNGGTVYDRGAVRGFGERHNWVEGRTAFYRNLPGYRQFIGAVRLDAGRFFGGGGQNADRFFLGGPRSVRSYGFRQLCPDAPAPEVGSCPLQESALEPAYFLASAELRLSPFEFPWMSSRGVAGFFKPIELVPFVDYGKVWNLRGGETFALNREFLTEGHGRGLAVGGGFRYPLFAVFTLRLDAAWGRPGAGSFFGATSHRLPDQWLIDLAQAF